MTITEVPEPPGRGTTGDMAAVPADAAADPRADYIRRIVDAAPPLSPQQCDQLARLMRPGSLAGPETPLEERRAS